VAPERVRQPDTGVSVAPTPDIHAANRNAVHTFERSKRWTLWPRAVVAANASASARDSRRATSNRCRCTGHSFDVAVAGSLVLYKLAGLL
jgi:hypothetical protein